MRKLFLLVLIFLMLTASGCTEEYILNERRRTTRGACEGTEQELDYLCIQGRVENVEYKRIPMYMLIAPQYLVNPQWSQKVTIVHINGRRLIILGDPRLNVDEIARLRLSRSSTFLYKTGEYPAGDIYDMVLNIEIWSQRKEEFRHRIYWNI